MLSKNNNHYESGMSTVYIISFLIQCQLIKNPSDIVWNYCYRLIKKLTSNSSLMELNDIEFVKSYRFDEKKYTLGMLTTKITSAIECFEKCRAIYICGILNIVLQNIKTRTDKNLIPPLTINKPTAVEPNHSFFWINIISNNLIQDNGAYIYCEPPHFKLVEFTEKISEVYKSILPKNAKLEIIRDSAPVDVKKLSTENVSED
ncbi:hypothetical protein RF11_10270 [Thelohanellus kitauei]|uniref:Uncharacterized protein n=1 Tax=Thelohanellus kitauei TaxID=669202 RepID=A0A0C2N789_THEKT|nr:hypothetical protein RF11_10270 [Thelohanellus kitauei]